MGAPEHATVKQRPPTRTSWKPGQGSANPGGRPRAFREYLRSLLGEHGEKAYDAILAIAEGETFAEVAVREPRPDEDAASAALIPMVRKYPTMSERLNAWIFLVEQLNGKSVSSIDVAATLDVTHTAPPRDLSKLSDAELTQLARMVRKASTINTVTVEPAALPAGALKP